MYKLFFKPNEPNSAAADFIPFFDDNKFNLFFLFDHRNVLKYGEGVAWYKVETSDFINFIDKGEMISRGSYRDLDLSIFTGSVIKASNKYHIFYTGHNSHIKTYGYQNECIMHAISDDLDNWTKIPEDTFFAPDGYDSCDFRDPFVYFDKEQNKFYMLLCARPEKGDSLRKGETIKMVSPNLKTWKFDSVLYAPHAYHTHECPDFFKIGKYYYLIFSEYSDRNVTCYRYSTNPNGPWIKPAVDTFDGRAFYAAKSETDGDSRYLFGWVPTRQDNRDNGDWMWGGNLVVHKIIQNTDGTLKVCAPDSLINVFNDAIVTIDKLTLTALNDCLVKEISNRSINSYYFSCVAYPQNCDQFGIVLHRNKENDTAYRFKIDLTDEEVSVNRFPCFPQNNFNNYELKRKIKKSNSYNIKLFVDNDIAVLYINDQTALSVRFCCKDGNQLCVYAQDGNVLFENISLKI